MVAFRQGLSETGYVEGQNLAIEYRWAEGHYDRFPALAADLVGRKVDVIVAASYVAAVAAKNATSTIPIVFFSGGDPVAYGLITSLARPGGNLTGFSNLTAELMPKRLELLSELVPQARVIALLFNPNIPGSERIIRDVEEAARAKGDHARSWEVITPPLLSACGRRWRAGSRDGDGGRRARACRSARPCAHRGRAAPSACSSASAAPWPCARR